jgi:UbiD family decarboxylase
MSQQEQSMGYRNLQQCVRDLETAGHLLRIDDPVDACLEAAEIHRRVFAAGGPALFFANVAGCRFRWSRICSARSIEPATCSATPWTPSGD